MDCGCEWRLRSQEARRTQSADTLVREEKEEVKEEKEEEEYEGNISYRHDASDTAKRLWHLLCQHSTVTMPS